jgi:hypothetical protein
MTESGKSETRTARTERLREALRENLKRRKAQARGRASEQDTQGPRSKPPESKEKR